MKLPRNISGKGLAGLLSRYGYEITNQTGSHIRLTTYKNGEHHLTIPKHHALRVGTLSAIIHEISQHHTTSREEILSVLFS